MNTSGEAFSTSDLIGDVILSIRKLLGDDLVEQLQMENSIFFATEIEDSQLFISIALPLRIFADYEEE